MRKTLDQILVIDVEATCWKGTPPPEQENEIIEIGLCTIEISSGKRLDKESILVAPQRSQVSPFCTELTTLTQAQVNQGISFQEACKVLQQKYQSRNRVWASYGDYDRNQFQNQCQSWKVPYPFGSGHINIKTLAAILYNWPHEVGMAEALKLLGLPLEGTHHRGGDDAWNIALILSNIFAKYR